jgi:hypothetical protein
VISKTTLTLFVALASGCFPLILAAESACLDSAVPKQAVHDLGHYAAAIAKAPTKLPHLKRSELLYTLGFGAITAALLLSDSHISNSIDPDREDRRESNYASNILVGAALGSSTIKYLVNCHERDNKRRNDAVREWEAMGMGLASVAALKYTFRRQRPDLIGSKGAFFDSGTSFPPAMPR